MNLILLIFFIVSLISAKELTKIDFHNKALSNVFNSQSCELLERKIVQADFGEAYYAKTNSSPSSNETFFVLIISSNETLLSASPRGNKNDNFICDISYCTEDEDDTVFEIHSPWLLGTAKRIHLNTTLSIADGAWELRTPALYFIPAMHDKIQTYSRYGWIGLRTESEAHLNFQSKNPTFSLLLNATSLDTASLIFGFDSSIADIENPLMVVTSDANWKLQMTSLSFGSIVYSDTSRQIPIIFDLYYQGITLPKIILDSLQEQMSSYNLMCLGPSCYIDSRNGLPSLVFGLADGKDFSLMPHQYMTPADLDMGDNRYLWLWLRSINQFLDSQDFIVLGWDILANFYTLFQQIDGINTISFYEINSTISSNSSTSLSDSSLALILVITGMIVLILLICMGIVSYIIRRNKSRKETETVELSRVEGSNVPIDSQEQSHFL